MAYRAWINQPSIKNPLHKHHGMSVIVVGDYTKNTCLVYPVEAEIISFVVPKSVLSTTRNWNRGEKDV